MPSEMPYANAAEVDVKSWLLTQTAFAADVCAPAKRSTICSLVAVEVETLMPSGRLTTSPTSVAATTGHQTVLWRISPDCSLTVSARTTASVRSRYTSAPTSI